MIRNKTLKIILHIVTILVTIFLCFYNDIFTKNLSTLTLSLDTYLLYVLYDLLILISFLDIAKTYLNKKLFIVFILSLILVLFPYSETNNIIKNTHLICCYLSFVIFSICFIAILWKYSIINPVGKVFESLFIMSLFLMIVIYAKYLCINGLMELIYLLCVNITMLFIDSFVVVK